MDFVFTTFKFNLYAVRVYLMQLLARVSRFAPPSLTVPETLLSLKTSTQTTQAMRHHRLSMKP